MLQLQDMWVLWVWAGASFVTPPGHRLCGNHPVGNRAFGRLFAFGGLCSTSNHSAPFLPTTFSSELQTCFLKTTSLGAFLGTSCCHIPSALDQACFSSSTAGLSEGSITPRNVDPMLVQPVSCPHSPSVPPHSWSSSPLSADLRLDEAVLLHCPVPTCHCGSFCTGQRSNPDFWSHGTFSVKTCT